MVGTVAWSGAVRVFPKGMTFELRPEGEREQLGDYELVGGT